MATVIVSVISDLVTDQRVHRTSQTLHEMGFTVLLVGTKKNNSLALTERAYSTKRIKMLFQKGFLFYAEWNIRLFFFLLFKKTDILLANDLDTLPANYLVSKLRRRVPVYDTHEFFTEMAELYNRPSVKKIWQRIESFLFPKVKYILTVNNSIAALYQKKYDKQLTVVRNIPAVSEDKAATVSFNFPANKKILLVQGAGLNPNRGLEELVQAMPLINEAFILVIAGSGLIIGELKKQSGTLLNNRIFFTGLLAPPQLQQLTKKAWCGFSLDKPLNINQQCSLPNKLFDYIAAGVPVITSNITEVAAIVNEYQAGKIVDAVTPQAIAAAVKSLSTNEEQYHQFKNNTITAARVLNWDNEKKILHIFFTKVAAENKIAIG
jgi:glycosyltransferase involved in cell wall biosynthesis